MGDPPRRTGTITGYGGLAAAAATNDFVHEPAGTKIKSILLPQQTDLTLNNKMKPIKHMIKLKLTFTSLAFVLPLAIHADPPQNMMSDSMMTTNQPPMASMTTNTMNNMGQMSTMESNSMTMAGSSMNSMTSNNMNMAGSSQSGNMMSGSMMTTNQPQMDDMTTNSMNN